MRLINDLSYVKSVGTQRLCRQEIRKSKLYVIAIPVTLMVKVDVGQRLSQ